MSILKWALIFFVISIIAGVLGFTGVSVASADIARGAVLHLRRDLPDPAHPRIYDIQSVAMFSIAIRSAIPPARW